jgi:putative transcriptional regulator
MDSGNITALRKALGLSQSEFGQLLGVHAMTASKWERGVLTPSAYQQALMHKFQDTATSTKLADEEKVKNLLIGAGVVAALIFLLGSTKK